MHICRARDFWAMGWGCPAILCIVCSLAQVGHVVYMLDHKFLGRGIDTTSLFSTGSSVLFWPVDIHNLQAGWDFHRRRNSMQIYSTAKWPWWWPSDGKWTYLDPSHFLPCLCIDSITHPTTTRHLLHVSCNYQQRKIRNNRLKNLTCKTQTRVLCDTFLTWKTRQVNELMLGSNLFLREKRVESVIVARQLHVVRSSFCTCCKGIILGIVPLPLWDLLRQ